MDKIHFSSKNVVHATPQHLFDIINSKYNFNTDVCALPENTKCKHYFDPDMDGLKQDWNGVCWMNPPYARYVTDKWVKKAYESSLKGAIVVCLLPARTDTKYFHNYCTKGTIYFIKGRLKFGGSKRGAPFPSVIVVFDMNKKPETYYVSVDELDKIL